MSKKVLILSGSPRKGGNSDLLCDEFMRGALEAGNQVEKIAASSPHICHMGNPDSTVQQQPLLASKKSGNRRKEPDFMGFMPVFTIMCLYPFAQ